MTKNSFVESLFRVRLTACISLVICALMAVRIPSVMYVAQGVFVVMAFVSIHSRGYKIRRKQTEYVLFELLFLAFCLISVAWSASQAKWAASIKALIQIYVISMLLFFVIDSKERFDRLSDSMSIAGWVILGYIVIATPASEWQDMIYGSYSLSSSSGRLGPTIGMHTNMCGSVLLIFLVFAVYKSIETKKKVFAIQAVLLFVCLLFTKSRMSLFAAGVGLFVFFAIYRRLTVKQIIRVGVVIAVIVSLIYLSLTNEFLYSFFGRRIDSLLSYINLSGQTDASITGRMAIQQKAVEVFKQHPIWGVGMGNFSFYNDLEGSIGNLYAHNNLLELLADVGIIGTILYYTPYAICVSRLAGCIKKTKNNSNRMLYAAFFSIIVIRLISDFSQVSYLYDSSQIILASAFAGVKVFHEGEKTSVENDEKKAISI